MPLHSSLSNKSETSSQKKKKRKKKKKEKKRKENLPSGNDVCLFHLQLTDQNYSHGLIQIKPGNCNPTMSWKTENQEYLENMIGDYLNPSNREEK